MSTDSKSFVQGVFRTLYAEHPEHWGNGLSFNNFSPANGESVYLVRTKEASIPIGFVGWQNRHECGKNIGYYSVGLLPEFRGQGYAKAAVAKIIAEKSAGVDEVRALIHHSNTASLHLAAALGVPVTKSASAMFPNVNTAANKTQEAAKSVSDTAERVNQFMDRAQGVGQTLGLAGAGGGLGYLAADAGLDDTIPGDPKHMRNKRLKLLAGLLGTGLGVGVDQLLKNKMNKQAAALLARAGKVVGPKILAMLKNKGVQIGGGAAAGAGLSAYENEKLFPEADTKLKAINILSGALTGAALPSHPVGASTALTGKQMGLLGLDTYMKDAPVRQNIANTQLDASKAQLASAQAARETAGTEQSTAKMLMEKARNLSNTDKALYGVAGAGLLGAGIYGANSLFGGKKKAPASGSVASGQGKNKAPGKIRFDIPSDAMPPEFFQGLMKAEESGKGRAKYACLATRAELLQEIEQDLT